MGFIAGFAGGVTLTLSLTYLALITHTSNRQAQSAVLRSQASTLDALVPPDDDPQYPGGRRRRNATVPLPDGTYRPRESLEQYRREEVAGDAKPGATSLIETAKTRWNSEVLSAVRWVQGKDWARVREGAEDGLARLLGVELSREPVTVEEVVAVSSPSLRDRYQQYQIGEQRRQQLQQQEAAHRVSDALHHARDTTALVARAMRDEAKEVVSEAREVVAVGVQEAKGAVERGVEKAHDLVEKTKAAVHLAEDRAGAKMESKLLHMSDIEKALAERYDSARREERMKRSVEEVLEERYLPLEKRDNSRLRGL
ncbi:hypothetical protein C7999DRAFT_16862 [Corynascus novoguineensis]|uniref:MICOS complex subunit MIC12 n=1 Tax=Corynascus novoguineensis TaxID=1126955 RepID=A0AAN7HGT8_9PEZI|nr:hypothetical protein C7999DRAFT_16862 [Corynascus novoguineensis]